MSRYIDAEIFERNMQNEWERNEISNGDWIHFREMINDEPTADVQRVVRGEWELIDAEEPTRYGCSVCKLLSWVMSNYCPNCGARMGDKDE